MEKEIPYLGVCTGEEFGKLKGKCRSSTLEKDDVGVGIDGRLSHTMETSNFDFILRTRLWNLGYCVLLIPSSTKCTSSSQHRHFRVISGDSGAVPPLKEVNGYLNLRMMIFHSDDDLRLPVSDENMGVVGRVIELDDESTEKLLLRKLRGRCLLGI